MLAKSSSKAKVLDLYASVIAKEKAKLKYGQNSDAMSTDSDSSHEVACVEHDSDHKKKSNEVSPEELAFLAQLNQDESDDLSNET